MRLVQFMSNLTSKVNIGVLSGNTVIDINAASSSVPNSLVDFLQEENVLEKIKSIVSQSPKTYPLSSVKIISPITKPDKIIGIGLNYKDHCDIAKLPYPPEPVVFSKYSSTIVGPTDDIVKSEASNVVDWEGELVVVIGKKGRNIPAANASDYIFGYTSCQDLTAKDWMKRSGGQFLLSKNMDTFLPLGPCIVTKDEIPDHHNVNIKTWVNGKLKQNGNTGQMIHRIDKLIEFLSGVMTLLPGDIILTGTPAGVGTLQNPPEALKKGDLLETEVEYIGKLTNNVV